MVNSYERAEAVVLIKRVKNVVPPSEYVFTKDNKEVTALLAPIDATGVEREPALRALLKHGGLTEVPDGVAQWRLAWTFRAAEPNSTVDMVRAFLAGHFAKSAGAKGVQGAEVAGRRGVVINQLHTRKCPASLRAPHAAC